MKKNIRKVLKWSIFLSISFKHHFNIEILSSTFYKKVRALHVILQLLNSFLKAEKLISILHHHDQYRCPDSCFLISSIIMLENSWAPTFPSPSLSPHLIISSNYKNNNLERKSELKSKLPPHCLNFLLNYSWLCSTLHKR